MVGFGIFALYYALQPRNKEEVNQFSICNLKYEESINLLNNLEKKEKILINDVGQYGNSLGFYHENYSLTQKDYMNGKTVFLRNLCTDEEIVLMNNSGLDEKVDMGSLKSGFYIAEVLDGLDRYYLDLANDFNGEFSSVTRNNYHNKIDVYNINQKDGLDESQSYLVLEVNEVKSDEDKIDIIIDPNAFYSNWDGSGNIGNYSDDYNESEITYEIGEKIVQDLKDNGFRAELSRDNHTPINVHGIKGRLYNAYEKQASILVNLRVIAESSSEGGVTSLYSSKASNKLATYITKSLVNGTSLSSSTWLSGENMEGVYASGVENNLDTVHILRESGGRYTGSGIYDEDYIELNYFAKDKNIGINAVVVEYGDLLDSNFIKALNNEKNEIARSTAKGIIDYLNIE